MFVPFVAELPDLARWTVQFHCEL